MAAESAFEDLRRVADWFSTSPQRGSLQVERAVLRLGTMAIALLGRELRGEDGRRRDASRHLLEQLAGDVLCRARVVSELRSITDEVGEYTDLITLCQADRRIVEFAYTYPGTYMFHAHQNKFAERGWMAHFEVVP